MSKFLLANHGQAPAFPTTVLIDSMLVFQRHMAVSMIAPAYHLWNH